MTIRATAVLLGSLLATHCLPAAAADARSEFFTSLSRLCGATFEGASVFPKDPAHDFYGKKLVANVASCTADELRIPFVVGEDRSRTWVLRKAGDGLFLQHDHRHADGTPDKVTMYGGPASLTGTAQAQSFLADAYTAELVPGAGTNVWTISLSPDGRTLTYALERDGKPRFKAELKRTAAGR